MMKIALAHHLLMLSLKVQVTKHKVMILSIQTIRIIRNVIRNKKERDFRRLNTKILYLLRKKELFLIKIGEVTALMI